MKSPGQQENPQSKPGSGHLLGNRPLEYQDPWALPLFQSPFHPVGVSKAMLTTNKQLRLGQVAGHAYSHVPPVEQPNEAMRGFLAGRMILLPRYCTLATMPGLTPFL